MFNGFRPLGLLLLEFGQRVEERHHLCWLSVHGVLEIIDLELLRADRDLTAAGSRPRVIK
jgi:hypothetical protein